jgi:hypothetical protein
MIKSHLLCLAELTAHVQYFQVIRMDLRNFIIFIATDFATVLIEICSFSIGSLKESSGRRYLFIVISTQE